jgi:hypothetical protein
VLWLVYPSRTRELLPDRKTDNEARDPAPGALPGADPLGSVVPVSVLRDVEPADLDAFFEHERVVAAWWVGRSATRRRSEPRADPFGGRPKETKLNELASVRRSSIASETAALYKDRAQRRAG